MLDLRMVYTNKMINIFKELKSSEKENIKDAYNICKKILKNAYNRNGINAGETHFSDVWLRDSCFASWGALKIDDVEIVKNFLLNVIENMKVNGQCPLRIGQKYFFLKYLKLKGPSGPTYIEDKYVSTPVDANALFIILVYKYIDKTKDIDFLKTNYEAIKNALNWYDTVSKENLIIEGHYAGWADSIKKNGHVLYTNAIYCYSIKCLHNLTKQIGDTKTSDTLAEKYKQTQKSFEDVFWNGTHLNDWVSTKETNKRLSIDGNALAILFDIIEPEKQLKILQTIDEKNMITPAGLKLIDQDYHWKHIYSPFFLIGLKDYHNGLFWLWVSCISCIAFIKNNQLNNGMRILNAITNIINKHQTVYEIYDEKGNPIKRTFYKSEEGFAWSAGLFVWAYETLFSSESK